MEDTKKLNKYRAFSSHVYGETGFEIIDEMLNYIPLDKNDIFVDLGSGVGNVVIQVASTIKCKMCYGIEESQWPATYARVINYFHSSELLEILL